MLDMHAEMFLICVREGRTGLTGHMAGMERRLAEYMADEECEGGGTVMAMTATAATTATPSSNTKMAATKW